MTQFNLVRSAKLVGVVASLATSAFPQKAFSLSHTESALIQESYLRSTKESASGNSKPEIRTISLLRRYDSQVAETEKEEQRNKAELARQEQQKSEKKMKWILFWAAAAGIVTLIFKKMSDYTNSNTPIFRSGGDGGSPSVKNPSRAPDGTSNNPNH